MAEGVEHGLEYGVSEGEGDDDEQGDVEVVGGVVVVA